MANNHTHLRIKPKYTASRIQNLMRNTMSPYLPLELCVCTLAIHGLLNWLFG